MNNCEHNFIHLDTDYTRTDRNYGNNTYERIDRFYCAKCLDEKEKVVSECEPYMPSWFNLKASRIIRD